MAARLPKTDAAPVATDSTCGAPAEGAPSPLDLKRSVRMHCGLFGLMLAAGLVGAAGYFFAVWPSYDAESLVYLQSASSPMNSSGVEGPPSPTNPQQSFMQQQMERVTRPEVLRGALARLPAGSWQHKGESEEDAEERLGTAITVEQVDGSQAGIIASASDATVAAALANAVAASFVESVAADRHAGDPRRTELLGEELERVKNAMAAERAELEKIKAPSRAEKDDPNVSESFDAGIENARTQLDRARTAHNDAARRLVSLAPADAATVHAE